MFHRLGAEIRSHCKSAKNAHQRHWDNNQMYAKSFHWFFLPDHVSSYGYRWPVPQTVNSISPIYPLSNLIHASMEMVYLCF
ncbi:MAG: MaoC family dehydratase [Desulfobacteraceae bacterium]|nr:MaoC family dehydratase [Desulfobacteraceae bacterium]